MFDRSPDQLTDAERAEIRRAGRRAWRRANRPFRRAFAGVISESDRKILLKVAESNVRAGL